MITFLERLTKRKVEIERKTGGEWQTLVTTVADGKEIDPDETLTALARLGKSTDDLAKGVELLNQRRAWSALVTAGAKAETEHSRITTLIEAEVAAFAALEEKHEATVWPMTRAKAAAAQAMMEASEARRRLVETASDPIRLQVVQDADEKLSELRQERAEFDRELRGKEDRLRELSVQEDRDLAGHVDRLKSDIVAMRAQEPSFCERAEKLNAESEAARLQLLQPEAIRDPEIVPAARLAMFSCINRR